MHKQLRVLATLGGAVIGLLLLATPAFAGTITSPASPFTVPGDATGTPLSFTVTGSGFTPGTSVYIEQCDGVSPSSPGWVPTDHCDLGTSPAARIVPASGNVSFPANDNNFGFTPFKGLSPQGQFTCGSPTDANPNDGLTFSKSCTVRLSTSNQNVTADQAFITLVLPDAQTPPPSTPEAPFAILLPVGGVLAAGAFLFLKKRRAPSSFAA